MNLASPRVRVINLGLIDTPEKSLGRVTNSARADVDLIFLYVTTYALSSTVLPAVRRAKVPVIILNLVARCRPSTMTTSIALATAPR